jgi:hypothetical protein
MTARLRSSRGSALHRTLASGTVASPRGGRFLGPAGFARAVGASLFLAVSMVGFAALSASCNALVGDDGVFLWKGSGTGGDAGQFSSFNDDSSSADSDDRVPGSEAGVVGFPLVSGTYELLAASGFVLDDRGGGGAGTVPDQWA